MKAVTMPAWATGMVTSGTQCKTVSRTVARLAPPLGIAVQVSQSAIR